MRLALYFAESDILARAEVKRRYAVRLMTVALLAALGAAGQTKSGSRESDIWTERGRVALAENRYHDSEAGFVQWQTTSSEAGNNRCDELAQWPRASRFAATLLLLPTPLHREVAGLFDDRVVRRRLKQAGVRLAAVHIDEFRGGLA